ncbi:MAG: nucleotidyltransferase substrate binding protein [Rhodocyclaceae bacterium]|nr:nucleotidyltransferase substrate binding protein [Rhodocyclaceae bacterium]
MTEQARWKYRFENYKRAFILLREAIEQETLSQLEQEGTIQRFEYTMELAWKVMKDYLESQNVVFGQVVDDIRKHYLAVLDQLHFFLLEESLK